MQDASLPRPSCTKSDDKATHFRYNENAFMQIENMSNLFSHDAADFVGAKPEAVLKNVFGYSEFRAGQKEIIQNILSGRDTLAVMPTGGGKSLCYQIPALIFSGVTIVVSPLIALMQDQVGALKEAGVNAVFLNSSLEYDEYVQTIKSIKSGEAKLIYVSPEGLATERVKNIFREANLKVSCITIDEAHCISEWGHDFRPDYLEIAAFRKEFPDAPCLALTATATKQVRQDVLKNLELKNASVLVSSFNRKNIFLQVQPRIDGTRQIISFIENHKDESGIIYCLSRKEVDSLAEELQAQNFSALPYHAGLSDEVRSENQKKFIRDQVDIMVATVAFGMGINKPNVRYVIHFALPKSIEQYYQEIGRAGRDGLPSTALLLYSAGDAHRVRYFFREKDEEESFKSEKLLQAMLDFANARKCRRQVLLNYFGEKYEPKLCAENAANSENQFCCDICEGGGIKNQDVTIPVQKFLSCIYRVHERFGAAHIIDILLGSRNQKVTKNNHNFLSTWGIGTELSKQAWFELVDAMENAGIIRRTGDYNVIAVTSLGKEILSNRDKVELPVRIDFESQKKAQLAFPKKQAILRKRSEISDSLQNDAQTQNLAARLKLWRKKTAEENNIPPYYIFSDKTLTELANKKPATHSELYAIHGIGEVKTEKFGDAILKVILLDDA